MHTSGRATKVVAALCVVLSAAVAPFGCGGSDVAPGEPCDTKGEQACADNKEMSCGEDLTWEIDEDCGSGKTCVIKSGGDADCE